MRIENPITINEIKKKIIRLREVENNDLIIFILSLYKYRIQNYSKQYIPVFQNVSETRLKCCTGYKIESESFDFISTVKKCAKKHLFSEGLPFQDISVIYMSFIGNVNALEIFAWRHFIGFFKAICKIGWIFKARFIGYFGNGKVGFPEVLFGNLQTVLFNKFIGRRIGKRFNLPVQAGSAHPNFFTQVIDKKIGIGNIFFNNLVHFT